MKKIICFVLCVVLTFGLASQAVASDTLTAEPVSAESSVRPVAYTTDFDGYDNVVGVLNSDGTKTAYLFASKEDAKQVDSITGLVSPTVMEPDVQLYGWYDVENGEASDTAIVDAPVYSNFPDRRYGTNTSMIIGESNTYGYGRAYMKFDISPLNARGIAYTDILSACLHFTESSTIEPGRRSVIQAYLVKNDWSESTITWNNRPDYDNSELIGCSNVGYSKSAVTGEPHDMVYVTKAVMAWMQGMNNYGILLKEKEDEYDNRFYSSNYTVSNKRPYVTISYSNEIAYTLGQGIVDESLYYIVNRETGGYLTAMSATTGTNVTQQDFRDEYAQTQQWKFTLTSSTAYYTITLGNTGLGLKNTSSTLGSNVSLGTTGTASNQTWRLYRNWNGTYQLQSILSPRGSLQTAEWDFNVFQNSYTCDFDHYDEWTLIPVSKGKATFFDFNIDINTTYGTNIMRTQAGLLSGYSPSTRYTNSRVAVGANALQTSSLFYFSGHGEPGKLNFYTSSGVLQGNLVVCDSLKDNTTDISMESWTPNSLAQLQLAVLSSCETGGNAIREGIYLDDNMAGLLYWLGAHNVISYFHETYQNYDLAWNSAFMTDVLLGRSLKTSKQRADYHVYDDYYVDNTTKLYLEPFGNTNERHDFGDESFRPGFTVANAQAQRNYVYQDIPFLSLPINNSDTSNVVYDGYGYPMDKIFSLPIDAVNDIASFGYSSNFDVYMDSYGGVYWFYEGTNILHSYEPFTENIKLGETIVNQEDALSLAYDFVDIVGYDVSDYSIRTSNQYSKNYTIQFYLEDDATEKLVFHMQSDDQGYVYINSFTAYNYNR